MESSTLFRIGRQATRRALRAQPELSEKFTAALLGRNIDLEGDLCDQLFNHSEKRLARTLLKLARFGQADPMPEASMPQISHETLAEIVGTTRSRVTHFMNKLRMLGDRLQRGHYSESRASDRYPSARLKLEVMNERRTIERAIQGARNDEKATPCARLPDLLRTIRPCISLDCATTSSVTLPLLATKYPLAHGCLPRTSSAVPG